MENTRSSYDKRLKWKTEDLYKSKSDFENDYEKLNELLKDYEKFKGHIMDDAETLYELLKTDEKINMMIEKIYVYAHLLCDEDTRDTDNQTIHERALRLYEKVSEAQAFITPELMKCPYDLVEKYIKEYPSLKEYERVLKEVYRFKEHTLSDEEEQLLSSISSSFRTSEEVFEYLSDADLKFGEIAGESGEMIELTNQNYHSLVINPDRGVRERAFKRLHEVYADYKNTYAKLLASEVENNNKMSKIRGYDSALEASLYANDIPKSIIDTLIRTVKRNIGPLSSYWRLKRELLGVDELHIYDTYTGIGKYSLEFTYDEAEELILASLAPLGKEYISVLEKAFDDGWIDSVDNRGKRGGAYCTKVYGVHPYVLLSFDGTLNSVSTLAHELGHAMHDYMAMNHQSYQDHGYSIFVAEVASQVNQILLSKYLIEKASCKEEKAYLIDDLIQDFKSTIIRQTMFAEFEVGIHDMASRGEVLTHKVLDDYYYKLNCVYYGENIVVDEEIKSEWERIPHFYMNFYVYQYATAYAAAIDIAERILAGEVGIVDKYLEFLSLGSTKSPVDSLKVAGVDMTDEEVLKRSFAYFDELINELKENVRC